jgi:CheY-like chemotaxis protein
VPAATVDAVAPAEPIPRRVLVIEDHLDVAESLETVLELLHHEVRVAHDGPSGIDLARTFHPDIVLCDIGLPGIDGYEVARRFAGDPALRATTLVALTGHGQAEDKRRAAAAGFAEHIAKPATLDDLERLLQVQRAPA